MPGSGAGLAWPFQRNAQQIDGYPGNGAMTRKLHSMRTLNGYLSLIV
jgi:hypothetical protein